MQKHYYLLRLFLKDFYQIILLLASFSLSAQTQLGASIPTEATDD
jgi:hypothetical protein